MNIFPQNRTDCRVTWNWAIPVLVVAIFLVGQLAVMLPAAQLGLISRETVETYPTILYLVIGSFAMIALLMTLWIKYFERRDMSSVGFILSPHSTVLFSKGYGLGLLMAATVVAAVFIVGGYAMEADTDGLPRDYIPILILMFAFILQSSTEELIFRGWMMGRIAARYGLHAGVIGNSLLFTLMHVDPDAFSDSSATMIVIFTLTTFLFSLFLSLLVIRQKSVLGASAWHAAWNWTFITWFGLPTTGIDLGLAPLAVDLMPTDGSPEWLTGGATGPEGSIMTLLVLGIACAFFLFRNLRSQVGSRGPQDTVVKP